MHLHSARALDKCMQCLCRSPYFLTVPLLEYFWLRDSRNRPLYSPVCLTGALYGQGRVDTFSGKSNRLRTPGIYTLLQSSKLSGNINVQAKLTRGRWVYKMSIIVLVYQLSYGSKTGPTFVRLSLDCFDLCLIQIVVCSYCSICTV